MGILFLVAILLALGVGFLGSKRKIGFGLAFAISLLNVIVGLVAVLCSKRITEDESLNKED